MKKIALFFIVAFVCLNGNDMKYDGEFAGKADKEAYSYEKKIRIMKRIGIEYCIKGNDFGERRTDIQVLNHYLRKLGLPPYGYTITFPPPEIKSYIDDKSIIGDKTAFTHYKNSNFSRFYVCLDIYDSKEYQAVAERVMKKYFKD